MRWEGELGGGGWGCVMWRRGGLGCVFEGWWKELKVEIEVEGRWKELKGVEWEMGSGGKS